MAAGSLPDQGASRDGARSRGSAPRVLRIVGYNAVTAAILLALVEVGFRVFGPELSWPAPRVEFGFPDPITLERYWRTDPDLLWVPRDYEARVAAARGQRPSIVFMGDSCTKGWYERRLAEIVVDRFPGSSFDWVTLGVDGWSSFSGLQQLQRDVLPIQPRAIAIYYGWNDHWRNFGLEDKDAVRFLHSGRFAQSAFLSRFQTVQLVDKTFFLAKMRFSGTPRRGGGGPRVSLDDFRDNLRNMVRIAYANEIIPILLTAPTSHRPGHEPAGLAKRFVTDLRELVPLHRRYVQAVLEVAAAEHVPLVDLHGEFDQLPQHELERLFTHDGIHLTPAGNRKIAELIDSRLDQSGLYRDIL